MKVRVLPSLLKTSTLIQVAEDYCFSGGPAAPPMHASSATPAFQGARSPPTLLLPLAIFDEEAQHVYTFRDGLIDRMTIEQ